MKLDSHKELQKFLTTCRKFGITIAKIDGMEFHLGAMPIKPNRAAVDTSPQDPLAVASVPRPNIALDGEDPAAAREAYEQQQTISADDRISTPDELTEEQLLNWSVRPEPFAEENN